MAGRQLAGALALTGDWALGENEWKDENDLNLLKLSVFVQGKFQGVLAAVPGAPAEGDIVVLNSAHATYPNQIAVYDEAAWVYFAPHDGLILWNSVTNSFYTYKAATGWTDFKRITIQADQAADYQPVLADANAYIPMNKATAQTFTVPAFATVPFPVGTRLVIEQRGAGQVTFAGAVGVTLRSRDAALKTTGQYSVVQLIHRTQDVWVVAGDVTA